MNRIPQSVTIIGIERTTAIVGAALTLALYAAASPASALAACVGSIFMIVNFFLLAILGGGIIATSRGGGLSMLGILLIPLKLAFFIGASYLIVSRLKVDLVPFVAGVLTQPAAILIEVWRTAHRAGPIAQPQVKGNQV